MNEIANFFWYGKLTKFHIKCINSFIQNNFIVKFWSYENIKIKNVLVEDANKIIKNTNFNNFKYYKNSKENNIQAFADVFRYKLLSENDGWWFDTDCFCLKDQNYFKQLRKNKSIICGYQLDTQKHDCSINNAVLFLPKDFAKKLEKLSYDILKKSNKWGDTGPVLVTKVLSNYTPPVTPVSKNLFYAIHWNEMDLFLKKNKIDIGTTKIKDSFVTHIWNNYLNISEMEKDSLLYNLLYNK